MSGFAVYVGGGMGGKSRVATLLHEFVPAEEAFLVAEAVKRVFDKNGDRKNKHLARLRFLVERIGFQAFRNLHEGEFADLRSANLQPLSIRPSPQRQPQRGEGPLASHCAASTRFAAWRRNNVRPQKQPGFFLVDLPLPLGDIEAGKLATLAEILSKHGDGTLHATQAQNLALRWISEDELPALHEKLAAMGLAEPLPVILRNLVACAGASTCRLGICLSRGLAKAVTNALGNSKMDLEKLDDLRIHISGCPNSCGRHLVADIGLQGAARRIDGRLVPHYTVQLGGLVAEGQTRFGISAGTIPAKTVPAFVTDLLSGFLNSAESQDFQSFVDNGGRKFAENLAARYRHVPSFDQDRGFYFDWEAEEPFSLAGRGPGECSAGVFDLIEVDLASALEAMRSGRLYAATVLAARSLLITRGGQPKSDLEALNSFQQHFVTEGLVDRKLERLIKSAADGSRSSNPEHEYDGTATEVATLVQSVKLLYESMDASLRFKPITAAEPFSSPVEIKATSIHDFRGVVCPLNYVKTKMALAKIHTGQNLLILLDEQGAKNVPESASKDGHTIVSVTRTDDHWRILIRKG